MRQPLENYEPLNTLVLHAAHNWKTDDTWSALLAEINQICQTLSDRWIDVEDVLPQTFKAVLIEADFIGTSYMAEIYTVGCLQGDHWTTDRDNDRDKEQIIVRRWMPIPK